MASVYFEGNTRGTSGSEVFQMLVAGLPAANSHLQGVIRGEQSGQQREVGHGAGAVLSVDPAADGLSFIRVSICWEMSRVNTIKSVHAEETDN